MPITLTYNPAKVWVEARDTVRFLVGDTASDKPFLDDGEIAGLLARRKLLFNSDPMVNASAVLRAAADAAEAIAAVLARDSEIVVDQVATTKSTAAAEYRKLTASLRAQALKGAMPSFQLPTGHSTTFVQSVDPEPDPDVDPSNV